MGFEVDDEIDYEPIILTPPLQIKYKYERYVINAPVSLNGINSGDNKLEKRRTPDMVEKETDERRLAGRQKQVDYGKNTMGYEKYVATVPKDKRRRGDPRTPDKYQLCSKRSWDGQVSKWRRGLHKYDPE